VILIVGVLVGLVLPAVAKSRAAARSVACMSRLRSIQVAARIYADHYRTLPMVSPEKSIFEFELPAAGWRCPEDQPAPPLSDTAYSAYFYLGVFYMDPPAWGFDFPRMKPKLGLRRYEENPMLPIFWDREVNHDGDRNVVAWNGAATRRGWD
jgi:type II secretory pathway pseudopilin PulG